MIKTVYVICAEKIICDDVSKSITAVDITDGFDAEKYPLLFQRFECLWTMSRSEGDEQRPDAKLKIVLNGKDLHTLKILADFQDKLRARAIVRLRQLVIPEPGILEVKFLLSEEIQASIEIEFRQRPGSLEVKGAEPIP